MTATRNARALVAILTLLLAVTLTVMAPSPASASTRAATAVRVAAQQIGDPYRWGASGPGAFDCSGLTSFAWRKAGISIPRTSRQQFASLPRVRTPRAGDLVVYGKPVYHIAVYAGGGKMIEAPRSGGRVRKVDVRRTNLRGYVRPA